MLGHVLTEDSECVGDGDQLGQRPCVQGLYTPPNFRRSRRRREGRSVCQGQLREQSFKRAADEKDDSQRRPRIQCSVNLVEPGGDDLLRSQLLGQFGEVDRSKVLVEEGEIVRGQGGLRRVIEIAVPEGGVVLDFFAGSGTIGHAVAAQNAEDGRRRRFIAVQLQEQSSGALFEKVSDITLARLRYVLENFAGANEQGLKAFKLASSNFITDEDAGDGSMLTSPSEPCASRMRTSDPLRLRSSCARAYRLTRRGANTKLATWSSRSRAASLLSSGPS